MIEQVKNIVNANPDAKMVLETVYENPYTELKNLHGLVELDTNKVNEILEDLNNKQILIELTSPASSNIESRVPKKIFLVNPDIEEELEKVL